MALAKECTFVLMLKHQGLKLYRSASKASHILDLSITCRQVVSFMFLLFYHWRNNLQYPLDRRLAVRLQRQFKHDSEKAILHLSLVTTITAHT